MGNSIRILLKHYADLHVPESVSLEHWRISPEKVKAYLKTNKWKKLVEEVSASRCRKGYCSFWRAAKTVGQWNLQARRLKRIAGRRPALTCVRIQSAEYCRRSASCSIVNRRSSHISNDMIGPFILTGAIWPRGTFVKKNLEFWANALGVAVPGARACQAKRLSWTTRIWSNGR